MRIFVMLEGSPAAIAAALATMPADLVVTGNVPAVVNTAGTFPAPGFVPPMPAGGDDDDNGETNANAPNVDKNGLPWDERIHAKNKAINGDGSWRKKKGVHDTTVAAVEAELRNAGYGVVAAPAPIPAIPAPAPIPAIPVPVAAPVPMAAPIAAPPAIPAMPMAAPIAAPPAIPAMPAPPPLAAVMPAVEAAVAQQPVAAAPAAVGIDAGSFMPHLTTQMQSGVITPDDLIAVVGQINAAYAPHGHPPIAAITDALSDANKLQYAVQILQSQGKW